MRKTVKISTYVAVNT